MRITGKNAVCEALTAKKAEKVYIAKGIDAQKILDLCRQSGTPYTFLERAELDKMCGEKSHQGVSALITDFEYVQPHELIEYAKGFKNPFILLLDGIEDPHNLGAIIRTAECAGVHGIIIPVRRGATVNETVIKTAAGAAAHIKIAKTVNIAQELERLKKEGFWTYALETGGADIYKSDLSGAVALCIGGEGSGVRPLVKNTCDKVVSLPLYGKVNSLNASVAAGIAVYKKVQDNQK